MLLEVQEASGWQAHSIRGFLSGTVKKRLGLAVENELDKNGSAATELLKPPTLRLETDMSAQSKLEAEIGGLVDLSRSELVTRWRRIYRCPPPKGVKRALLDRAIAWHVQARHFGALSPVIKRRLREVAGGGNTDRLARTNSQTTGARSRFSISPSSLAPGTRLIRQWHGRNHCVDVIEEGFVFEGKTFLSLSAIAREITGARWSGPRFFGL